ncbi:phospholipase D-like domain-containing protein DpdK [Sorangium sp. So ce291]|uniref:phospholipase D-like domain-containing protein DpdK n=1 Tax=Sorangium sp. So ce291 TaxID=3133294 RepID=UPI003F6090C5
MNLPPRQLLQTAAASRNAVRELLQSIFTAELLAPSRCLWIVSPWLRDVPVIDNTTGAFQYLGPDFPFDEVRLSRVLRDLLYRGTEVVIATRPDLGNRQVFEALGHGLGSRSSDRRLTFLERTDLHAKGIVGDRYSLAGSMNLTFNGIENLTEMLVFQTDREQVEELRIMFLGEYGGRP